MYDKIESSVEGTIGAVLIIIGGVAVIALLIFCMCRRCQRIRGRIDENDDIEKGRRRKSSTKGRNRDRWKSKERKSDEKKRVKQKEKRGKSEWNSDDSCYKHKQKNKKRRIYDIDTDDADAKKKAQKQREKKIEKKIEKKLQEKMKRKMDKKIDRIIDEKIDKKSDHKKKKKRKGDGDSDSDRTRGRRCSSHHHHKCSRARRSPRRRRHDEKYYDPDGYYHSRRSSFDRRDPWDVGYRRDRYSRNGSLWHGGTNYPKNSVRGSKQPESQCSSWRSDHQGSHFLASPVKPLRSSAATLPTMDAADQNSWSSYTSDEISDGIFLHETDEEETPSMKSFSDCLIHQMSIYRPMKTTTR